jgi:hypothetical protein
MRKLQNPQLLTSYIVIAQEADDLNEKATSASIAALDELVASGFNRVTDYISPLQGKRKAESTITPEEYEYVMGLIKAGFPEDIQEILPIPAKALTERQKSDKRHYTQQAGSRFGAFGRQIATRLKAESEGRTGNQPRQLDVKCIDHLNAVIKACQKAEDAPFDVTKVAKQCETVIKLIGTKSK